MDSANYSSVVIDYRERPSGIPELLCQNGLMVFYKQLSSGDYIINGDIIIERKRAEDFIQSLLSGRLFSQCEYLVKLGKRAVMILEGNPYNTQHQIDNRAIEGAILSLNVSWQIPVIYTKNARDTASTILIIQQQDVKQNCLLRYYYHKPKRIINHRLKFLQGLPNVGSVMAYRLLQHFGSIEAIINADIKALQQVSGLGKKIAEKIHKFLSEKQPCKYSKSSNYDSRMD